jgi:hypothetical protein
MVVCSTQYPLPAANSKDPRLYCCCSDLEGGSLAQIFERLGLFTDHDNVPVNFQPHAADILVHAVRHWDYFLGKHSKLPKIPTNSVLYEKLFREVFAHWNEAGRPSHGLDGI